jgi:hypothetical protein
VSKPFQCVGLGQLTKTDQFHFRLQVVGWLEAEQEYGRGRQRHKVEKIVDHPHVKTRYK